MATRGRQDFFVVEGIKGTKYCAVFEPRTHGVNDIIVTADSPAVLKEKYKIFRVVDSRHAVSLHRYNFYLSLACCGRAAS